MVFHFSAGSEYHIAGFIACAYLFIIKYHISGNIVSDFNLVDHSLVVTLKFAITYNL